jgi:glycosyltransferase involved in cell wall biosynthesis
MTDPLGQSQVIPYLIGLSKKGYQITILSFEKKERFNKGETSISDLLKANNIRWEPISYTKNPPVLSTLIDLSKMKRAAMKLYNIHHFDIVHCRSYISSLGGLFLKRKTNIRFIFDMRGFWADERVEGGLWNLKNPIYKKIYHYFKQKEKEFVEEADYIISLTNAGKKELENKTGISHPLKIKVIPCCVDTELFNRKNINKNKQENYKIKLNIKDDDFVISYLGAIGTWYLLDEMLFFFKRLLINKPNALFLFITNESVDTIYLSAKNIGIQIESIRIISASRMDVPILLSLSKLNLFFIKPSYSKIASSPTKLAEVMGMGIPVITNKGVGDVDEKVNGIGILVSYFSNEEFDIAIESLTQLLNVSPDFIRQKAIELFSLQKGINSYREVYEDY